MKRIDEERWGISENIDLWLLRCCFWLSLPSAVVELVGDGTTTVFYSCIGMASVCAIGMRYCKKWREHLRAASPIPEGMIRVTLEGRSYDVPPTRDVVVATQNMVEIIRSARR